MLCLGFEPGTAEWKAQTNPLSNGSQLLRHLNGKNCAIGPQRKQLGHCPP